jgi:hypothetical protein
LLCCYYGMMTVNDFGMLLTLRVILVKLVQLGGGDMGGRLFFRTL